MHARTYLAMIPLASLVCSGPFVAARSAYTFSSLDVPFPGAFNTRPNGIVRPGQFVGVYQVDDFRPLGFSYVNGHFDIFNVPGAVATSPAATNRRGDVAGIYHAADGRAWGFIYRNDELTTLTYDRNPTVTVQPMGMNNAGQTVGRIYDSGQSLEFGFRYSNSVLASIEFPGARLTAPSDINDSGVIVGWYQDSNLRPHAFIYADGVYTSYDVPGAWGTLFSAINNRGHIAGLFYDPVRVGHGLLYADGTLTVVDVPGASFSEATDVDDAGAIVGTYLTGDRDVDFKSWRGFVATRRPDDRKH